MLNKKLIIKHIAFLKTFSFNRKFRNHKVNIKSIKYLPNKEVSFKTKLLNL